MINTQFIIIQKMEFDPQCQHGCLPSPPLCDLQNLTRLSVEDNKYSLSVLSKLTKPFVRYCVRTNKRTGQPKNTMSGGDDIKVLENKNYFKNLLTSHKLLIQHRYDSVQFNTSIQFNIHV